MNIQILDRAKKKKIVEQLQPFGIPKVPELLIKVGSERITAYSGHLSTEEIYDLWRLLPLEGIGLYIAKEQIDKRTGVREVRLSLNGAQLYRDTITHNTITLNEAQEKEWFLGKDIELSEAQQAALTRDKCVVVVIAQSTEDIIGTGKVGVGKALLYNYLPKERRRKSAVIS